MLFLILVFFKRALWVCEIKANLLFLIETHFHLYTTQGTSTTDVLVFWTYNPCACIAI